MEVNIEKIMDEIREEISEFDEHSFKNTVSNINSSKQIPVDMPILGKAKGFKKIIGKTINFAIKPRVEAQNKMNNSVSDGFTELMEYIDCQNKKIDKLNRKIDALEKELKERSK